ncbi:MAG: hypothetical protein ACXVMS_12345 [Flavisolibacter sp.]
MRLLLSVLLTVVLAFMAGLFFPWWSIAPVAFLVALVLVRGMVKGFLSGFIGIFILWGLLSFWIDLKNKSILSQKISQLFHLGQAPYLMILITALAGGLVGGFAAMTGSTLLSLRPQRLS